MKSVQTIFICLLFLFSFVLSNAQITTSSQWTWVNGASTAGQTRVYGTMGTPAAANNPGARY